MTPEKAIHLETEKQRSDQTSDESKKIAWIKSLEDQWPGKVRHDKVRDNRESEILRLAFSCCGFPFIRSEDEKGCMYKQFKVPILKPSCSL